MKETSESLRRTQEPNPASLESLFHVLNPISFILSHNSSPGNPIPLRLTTESSIMERDPRYGAYAELRETKLRMKSGMMKQEKEEIELKQMPTKKQKERECHLLQPKLGKKEELDAIAKGFELFSFNFM
ncbi:hypothetical protein J1N35_000858 [Gossypium stocksii]|uniref:Uncharacterized protein n=1 Tax=Gossypium stocksii TaxID=47602 RepID=A0A9D4AJ25_9ROSI|nr:hypothetical protein J1N35_000858 [Gossypium stocksii]